MLANATVLNLYFRASVISYMKSAIFLTVNWLSNYQNPLFSLVDMLVRLLKWSHFRAPESKSIASS